MAAFLYRCPNLGQYVQGWSADEVAEDDLQMIKCLACRRWHLVDPATGKVIGADDE
jgi:hypothetical protein